MSEPKSRRVLVKRPPHEAGFDPAAWRVELKIQAREAVDRILEKRWLGAASTALHCKVDR